MSKPQMRQRSLLELGQILIGLHRQGYTAEPGYSFTERDNQFGRGSITVQAICIPPPEPPPSPPSKPSFWRRLWFRSASPAAEGGKP